MARVFISYARADGKELAADLDAQLQDHDSWFDQRDLPPGVTWDAEIEEGIDGCEVFLVVLTRAYQRAEFARNELARAIDKRKPIVPLLFHAGADLSIRIQRTQWLDFTDPATYEQRLADLRTQIGLLAQGGSVAARDLRAGNWNAVQVRTAEQSREVLKDLFNAELYVRRRSAEEQFARFLESPSAALLVIGDSGVGKTTLLSHWTLELLRQGHAVLLYDCSVLEDADVEEVIARDLGIPREKALEEIEAAAADSGKKFYFIFDSIGDYRGAEENGPQALLRNIHTIATRRIHAEHARVIASCNSAMWGRIAIPLGSRYFTAGDEPFLRLGTFTEAERDEAYGCYRENFKLYSDLADLPIAVRERLREPVLLRMTAEVYRDAGRVPVDVGTRVYKLFFKKRVNTIGEQTLVDDVVEVMLRTQNSALSMNDLKAPEQLPLRTAILDEDPGSTYAKLLDRGVLQEVRDLRGGFVIRFSHTRVAAYAVARRLLNAEEKSVLDSVRGLLGTADRFPLAWDSAKTLLLLGGDEAALTALAASRSLEERELAVEALVELHGEDTQRACTLLQMLLDGSSEEGRRTALKAAYNIGPLARDFFMRAAIEGGESLRESVRNTLYLMWRRESPAGRRALADTVYLIGEHSRGFTYGFLESLVDDVSVRKLTKLKPTLEFALDLVITIYINHCDEDEVIEKTATLMHKLTVNKLRMPLLLKFEKLDPVRKIILRAFTGIFGSQILNFMFFGTPRSVQEFFRLQDGRRASLGRMAEAFDPTADLAAYHGDLAAMLSSGMPMFSGSASTAIAVHAAHDFAAAEPLVRQLWNGGGPEERLWILTSFSVLMKATPPEWVALLEDLTRQYVEQHRDVFLSKDSQLPGGLDIVLLPLGLAYSKAGSPMPLLAELLRDALANNDTPLAARIIAGLAAVGFYDPLALFGILDPAFAHLGDEATAEALVNTLATVRTLHFDAVDRFLHEKHAPETLRHRINIAADIALVHNYIRVLGYYNNAVHFTLRYPRMRPLSAGALKLLATTPSPPAFATDYTMTAIRMLRDSEFDLRKWTLPE